MTSNQKSLVTGLFHYKPCEGLDPSATPQDKLFARLERGNGMPIPKTGREIRLTTLSACAG